jgi:hypothetical protein
MPSNRGTRAQRSPRGGTLEFWRVVATSWASDVRTLVARMFGVGNTSAGEQEQESEEAAEVLQPLGVTARPDPSTNVTDTNEAVVIRDGDETHVLLLVNKGLPKLTDSDLMPGEVMLHGASVTNVSARVVIKKNGDAWLVAKGGQKVLLNTVTGGKKIAAHGDSTAGHTHTATFVLDVGGVPVTGTITIASATDTINVTVDRKVEVET